MDNELEGEYRDGKKEGLWTYRDKNGQKVGEGEFKDDKQEGLWTLWEDNGQMRSEFEWN